MVKLRNLFLRLSSIGLAVCLIMALFVPVSAFFILDFNDYVVSTGFDADCNIYHCYFPFTSDTYNWYCADTQGIPLNSVDGVLNSSSVTYSLNLDNQYTVLFFPTGGNRWISLDNIPNGTKFSMWVEISSSGSYVTPDVCFVVRYLDSSGNIITDQISEIVRWGDDADNFPPRIYGSVSISKPSGAVFACIYANIYGISPLTTEDIPITFTGSGLSMDVSISALYELQQQTGRTNAILQKVEQQLADQGQTLDDVLKEQQDTNDKLDDIINGTVEPSSPAGSDSVGDLIDQEDQLIQDMNPGFDAMDDLQADVLEQILGYSQSLSAVSWLLNQFIGIPFIYIILAVSLSLGLTGTILGLFNTIASRYRSDAREWKNYQNRMGRHRGKGG